MINLIDYQLLFEEWYTMSQAAKIIAYPKMGRTKLFRFLKEQNVLWGDNEPYQHYIDNRCFKLVQKDVFNGHGRIIRCPAVPLISEKGINLIKKLLKKKEEENGEN